MPADPAHPVPTRTSRFAWGAVVITLVGVIALVVYSLTDTPTTLRVLRRATTAPSVLKTLARVPLSTFDSVGVTSPDTGLSPPTVITKQAPLYLGGKPEVLFVGAEYCPFCAAERWPLVLALSRFGSFGRLHDMRSSTTSVFPGIETFSFFDSSYTSPYLTFTGIEVYSDVAASNGVFTKITTLTPSQQSLVTLYGSESHAGNETGTETGGLPESGPYPLVTIADTVVATTSGFSPVLLMRLSQSTILNALMTAETPASRSIVASANYLAAGICAATKQQPASVCSSKGVHLADLSLGIA